MLPSRVSVALLGGAVSLGSPACARAQPTTADPGFATVGSAFVAIQVDDVEAAARWYEAALSLTPVNAIDAADGAYAVRILSDGRLTLELIRARGVEAPSSDPHLGLFKVGFFVDDIEAAQAWLQRHGARVDATVFVDEALDVRSFVWRDPFGNRMQVFARCDGACGTGGVDVEARPGGGGGDGWHFRGAPR